MKSLFFACALLLGSVCYAQTRVSLVVDLGAVRNFSPGQQFWAIGQTTEGDLNLSKKEAAYAWILYFTPGRFTNTFHAGAKAPGTSPAVLDYKVKGSWRIRHFGMGWKHYFAGAFDAASGYNLYGRAGLGILFLRVENQFLQNVDTSLYLPEVRPENRNGEVTRLTLDLGLGLEKPVGANFNAFAELRTLVRTSEYPSTLLHDTRKVPKPYMFHLGMRLLFGD